MSAAFVGLLILAGAGWGWGQAETVRLPIRSWTLATNGTQGVGAVGDTINLYRYAENISVDEDDIYEVFGSALIESFEVGKGANAKIVINSFSSPEVAKRGGESLRVAIEKPGESPTMSARVKGASSTPIFPVLYLQAGTAGAIMLIGATALYIYVGSYRKTVGFLIATDGEMKKVNWTSYREVKGSTIVVITATFLIAGFLFGVDTIFAKLFTWIGVLQN
ncbi:MAG: preprotein translocase subunit SecE [Phycisphaerales bacterium]|nr:preprotein translocase subunit SecE [Phycisphaerales bacterium]